MRGERMGKEGRWKEMVVGGERRKREERKKGERRDEECNGKIVKVAIPS